AAYAYHTITRLEAKYPPRRLETFSTEAFRATSNPATHRTSPADIDVYTARVPAAGLRLDSESHSSDADARIRSSSIEEAWTRTLLESPILRAEARFLGRSRSPGDCGEHGFYAGQRLLNVVFRVRRPPAPGEPLLVTWRMPDGAVAFAKRMAAWGAPWRLMTGGRQEYAVGEVDAEGMVEVGFAAAQDFEVVAEEGEAQKTVPGWLGRVHRGYAMLLLDERAEEIRRRA
ncbi:hypothetical protein L226DRAFT_443962, partial [Lentinus tigrinus ALCF2SS1-7]